MKDTIAKSILLNLFSRGIDCGPNLNYKQYFQYANETYSDFVDRTKTPWLIPAEVYNPNIKIAIDFTHQFVLNTDNLTISKKFSGYGKSTQYEGRRIISKDNLKHYAVELVKFFSYYFDYVLSYGKNNNLQFFMDRLNNLNSEQDDILPFLNNIINYFLVGVSVERSRTNIGSCTITLRDNPNYKDGQRLNIFLDKTQDILSQLFVPMLPVMIWARGRFYRDWYFPIFDGYITYASFVNNSGYTTLTINCKDSLELARISSEMINPAIIQVEEFRKQSAINIFTKPFYGLDQFTIFNTMFHGGSIVYSQSGGKIISTDELEKLKQIKKLEHDKGDYLNFTALGNFGYASQGDTASQQSMTSDKLAEEKAIHKDKFNIKELIRRVSHVRRPRYTSVWGQKITPYRIFEFQSINMYTSDFSSRLDVLRQISSMTYYELYVDGYGNVQFHPMRLANEYLTYDVIYDVNGNEKRHRHIFPGVQIVGPDELMNVNTGLNVEELITFLRLKGIDPVVRSQPEPLRLVGSAIDRRYMERYGYRRAEIQNPLFNNNPDIKDFDGNTIKFLDLAARSLLKFRNAELYTRTASMVFRPELDIACPVLFTDDNNIFYIRSLSHSITIGGQAVTNINCNFGRKDYQIPPDLANYMLISEKMYKTSGDYISYIPTASELLESSRQNFIDQEQEMYRVLSNEMWAEIEKQDASMEEMNERRKKTKNKSKKKKKRDDKAKQKLDDSSSAREKTVLEKAMDFYTSSLK